MVFQDYALYPHLNVFRNLAFGLKMRRIPRSEIERRVQRAARILGIESVLQCKPGQLSGGQRQRVAIGRAIVRDPEVFLFDEPLSNLDANLRAVMRTELVRLQRTLETTMIHVTHDQGEAMMIGDRIAVMSEGQIQQVGAPMEVYRKPANRFVAAFLGSPPMNFLEGELTIENGRPRVDCREFAVHLPAERLPRCGPWSGKQVTVGVRPESILVAPGGTVDPAWSPLRVRVIVAQPLGAETILDLECEGVELTARVDPSRTYSPGEDLPVYVVGQQCHLFDPAAGDAF
jgi:multiple sugar transport system ATP-binding protein